MRRIAVAFFYDKSGIIDAYFFHLLRELKVFISEIVVVSNGPVSTESARVLESLSVELLIRKNEGYDVWAYKECLAHIGQQRIATYDEVILFNHTFYGPIFPFSEMFAAMDASDVDFWGITGHKGTGSIDFSSEGPLAPHINSHFIAIRKQMASSVDFDDYWQTMGEVTSYTDSIVLHEGRFTQHFEKLGYKSGTYIKSEDFRSDYPLFEQLDDALLARCPIIKRRTFFVDPILADQLALDTPAALDILKQNSNYDIGLIWKNLLRTTQLRILHTNAALLRILPLERSQGRPAHGMKVAVCAHVYYIDMLDELLERCRFVGTFALIATTDTTEKKQRIEDVLRGRAEISSFIVEVVEKNIGADVAALLITAAPHIIKGGYDVVCRIHTKKSPKDPAARAKYFKMYLMENLLASAGYVDNLLDMFATNPHIGLAIPPAIHVSYSVMGNGWFTNRPLATSIAERLGLDVEFDEDTPVAPYGSMFWFRPDALRKLLEFPWHWDDFEHEGPYSDGDPPHALERLYAYTAQDAGFLTMAVMSPAQAERSFVRLEYKVQKYSALLPAGDFAYNCHVLSKWKSANHPLPLTAPPTLDGADDKTKPPVISAVAEHTSQRLLNAIPSSYPFASLFHPRRKQIDVHIDNINGLHGVNNSGVVLKADEDTIILVGWTVPKQTRSPFAAIVVRIGEGATAVSCRARLVKRPDIARAYGIPDFIYSGFFCSINIEQMARGPHIVSVLGVEDGGDYRQASNVATITLK